MLSCVAAPRHLTSHPTSDVRTNPCILLLINPAPTDVDGGMFAHDPSSYALTLAMSRLKYRPEDISLFSIGTGFVPKIVEGDSHDYGMVQWVPYVANILWCVLVDDIV